MATADVDRSTVGSTTTSSGTLAHLRESFKRVLSPERSRADARAERSPTSPEAMTDRSRSRGREFQSTGRGGAGNIVRSDSVSRNEDAGQERGREILPANRLTHSGRGGAGNIRSPSRDPEADLRALSRDREIIEDHRKHEEGQIHSTGRGGYGNMDRSRSRSREPRSEQFHSTGRGGIGNITNGDGNSLADLKEEDRVHHAHVPEFHSSGRGGAGNIASGAPPIPEIVTRSATVDDSTQWHSSGRGGAGNMKPVHPIDPHGAAEEARGRSTGLGGFIDRLTSSRSRDPQNRDH